MMHHPIRRLLGLTAACAIAVAGGSAVLSPAGAATAPVTAAFQDDPSGRWGPIYSRHYGGSRAHAVGRYELDEEHGDKFTVQARLYDRGSPSRLCGYLEVKFETDDDERVGGAKRCGPKGFAPYGLVLTGSDVPIHLSARVCYWDTVTESKKYCGKWVYVYSASEEEEEEE
ncbi:hypothetical protein ACFOWE_00575 [Planomonospora corallina]|uniref:Uncharacterized protein n=1 Tax=Planomonospora corallina TaxID=1806052 RepID=A0ABV8HY73_9ACTN